MSEKSHTFATDLENISINHLKNLNNMGAITIDTLLELCKQEVRKGNGKKKILLSDDDEGNGYHQLFFGFTPTKSPDAGPTDFFTEACLNKPYGVTDENINEFIILG